MGGGFFRFYLSKISAGTITHDDAQNLAAKALDDLSDRLTDYQPSKGLFAGILGKKDLSEAAPKGLYLYGGVGRGKTMLMDFYFDYAPFDEKKRFHFNEFMAISHDLINQYRKSHEGDPIPLVAEKLAQKTKLICFDEFYVTDIADAMILGRLFDALFKKGLVIIATSNCPIPGLYKDGLNRQLFMPFIELMNSKMMSHEFISERDFRLRDLEGNQFYFTPNDQAADEALCSIWRKITGQAEGKQAQIIVKGRTLIVPEAGQGAARFTFDDLCTNALGRDDYLALAERYHTIFIEDIPQMGPSDRNQARRFITLIDTLYDSKIRLVASAEVRPENLYKDGDNAFLFERTASRLIEMQRGAHLEKQAVEEKHLALQSVTLQSGR